MKSEIDKPALLPPARPPVQTQRYQKDTFLTIWDVPPELKLTFKAACARKGKSMRDVVLEFMRKYSNA